MHQPFDRRLAIAKPVQVGAVEDRDLLHGVARECTRIGADCQGRIRVDLRDGGDHKGFSVSEGLDAKFQRATFLPAVNSPTRMPRLR